MQRKCYLISEMGRISRKKSGHAVRHLLGSWEGERQGRWVGEETGKTPGPEAKPLSTVGLEHGIRDFIFWGLFERLLLV